MTRNTLRAVLLAGVALGGLAVPAAAQSVQDLQLVIQQQRQELERQRQQLEALEQKVNAMGTAAPAPKKMVTSGSESVKLTVSGQINRGVLFADDGVGTEVFHVDNDNSSTRVRFVGEGKMNDDVTIGSNIEVEIQSNDSNNASQTLQSDGTATFADRKLEVFVDSKAFGRLSVGQGDTASNGIAEIDLSGTDVIGYSSISDMAGGVQFRNARNNALTGTSVGAVFDNLDGLSRRDRVRYDSPKFAGLQASGSVGEDGIWDVAGRYAGDFGFMKVGAGVAYAVPSRTVGGGGDHIISGSVSALHESGFNLTFASGTRAVDNREDPFFWYLKGGYIAEFFPLGSTAFSIDYNKANDFGVVGDDAESFGGFIVQNVEAYGTEIYFGVRNHSIDRGDWEDILAVLTGARVKF